MYYSNWLTQLWRPGSPTTCTVSSCRCSWRTRKAGGVIQSEVQSLRTRGVQYKPPSSKAQEPGGPMCDSRRRWTAQLKRRDNAPFPHLLFCRGPHPCWRRPSSALSLLNQKLTPSRNSLMDAPRNNYHLGIPSTSQVDTKITPLRCISGSKWQSHKLNKPTWQRCYFNPVTMPRYYNH